MACSSPGSTGGITSDCASSLARSRTMRLGEPPRRRHDTWSVPTCSVPHRPTERRDSLEIVEIVDPLQHHALHSGSLQLAELRRDLSGGTDDSTFAPKLVSALARQSLAKLVIVLAED